jgi:FkbM family methyltransferase
MSKTSINVLFFALLSISPYAFPANIKHIIKSYLPENPVILDVGAHTGTDTVELARIWPKGHLIAIEAVPFLYEHLIKNTRNESNVSCYQFALSDKCGRAKFYVSSGSGDSSSSILAPKEHLIYHPTVLFKDVIEVETMTLDQWAKENGISHIDFMWLDMQGHELAMLKACPEILKTVNVIYTEVSYLEVYAGCALFPEMRQWLEAQGFGLVYEEKEAVDYGNALFIRNKK